MANWYGDYTVDLEVVAVKGGVDHIISLGGSALDSDVKGLEITVNASNKGTAQKPKGKGTDISDFSERELRDLFSELGEALSDELMGEFGSYLY